MSPSANCPRCNPSLIGEAKQQDQLFSAARDRLNKLTEHIKSLMKITEIECEKKNAIRRLMLFLYRNREALNGEDASLSVDEPTTSHLLFLLDTVFFNGEMPRFIFRWEDPLKYEEEVYNLTQSQDLLMVGATYYMGDWLQQRRQFWARQDLQSAPEYPELSSDNNTPQIYVDPSKFSQSPTGDGCKEHLLRGVHRISVILHEMIHVWLWHYAPYKEISANHGIGFVEIGCLLEEVGSELLDVVLGGELQVGYWGHVNEKLTPLEEDDDDDGSCDTCVEVARIMRIGGLQEEYKVYLGSS
ncbi:unnamed protein product [Periconia digitata]|uniref:Uncharacterized protein n=1 Tax=Periconia digitata TaxID=1303443 RepID=A0A9W4UR79_9PLEO|nr:unnamed protein product [Periconia digitata]